MLLAQQDCLCHVVQFTHGMHVQGSRCPLLMYDWNASHPNRGELHCIEQGREGLGESDCSQGHWQAELPTGMVLWRSCSKWQSPPQHEQGIKFLPNLSYIPTA